jgi:hypothetical protein
MSYGKACCFIISSVFNGRAPQYNVFLGPKILHQISTFECFMNDRYKENSMNILSPDILNWS